VFAATAVQAPDASGAEAIGPEHRSIFFLALLIGVLLSATSSLPFALKWTSVVALVFAAAFVIGRYFSDQERKAFFTETWDLAKKIFPLLIAGAFITGVIGYFLAGMLYGAIAGYKIL